MDKTLHADAYYNGCFLPRDEIRIPLSDRAVFFGDGIYDAAPGRNGCIFFEDEHLERFFSNAKAMDINVKYTPTELKSIFKILIRSSGYETFFLYFQLTRASAARTHSYAKDAKSNLLVTVSPLALPSPDKCLKLILREDKRYKFCHIKTLNLIPAVLASHEAESLGADETVFSRGGIITECAHSNVHIIKNCTLITHPLNEFILPGISRAHLLAVCKRSCIKYEERTFSERELFSADEILITSSSKLCMRASSVEGKALDIKDGSIGDMLSRRMISDFMRATDCEL